MATLLGAYRERANHKAEKGRRKAEKLKVEMPTPNLRCFLHSPSTSDQSLILAPSILLRLKTFPTKEGGLCAGSCPGSSVATFAASWKIQQHARPYRSMPRTRPTRPPCAS